MSFEPIIDGIRSVLESHEIHSDRIQIPMTKSLGFRHPRFYAAIMTWKKTNGFADSHLVEHSKILFGRDWAIELDDESITPSAYRTLANSPHWSLSADLENTDYAFELFDELRAQGLRYYFCFKVPLPTADAPALVSISAARPFPKDLEERIMRLQEVIGLTLYAAYRTSQAVEVSAAYVGPRTGLRVLEGAIERGASETIPAGIMFCDIRGFTSLSEKLGYGILPVMNQIFDAIGSVVVHNGGEILKFIGDAMLIIFPIDDRSEAEVAQAMVDVTRDSLVGVDQLAHELELPVAAGFGCHIGEVIYGNIGTQNRLDFTVIGRAVNLTSRLESLCKPLKCSALFSEVVQKHNVELKPMGAHPLKGIATPVDVWTLP